MPLGIHFGCKIAPLLVQHIAVLAQQSHRLDRKSQHRLGAFLVEPFHKPLLQPVQPLPVGLAAVGEKEVAEQTFEIVTVVVRNVPEDSLIVARPGRLIDGIDNLFEAIGNDFIDRTLLQRKVHHLFRLLVILTAVLQPDEIVEIHQKLGRGTSSAQHARNHEHHVDEAPAERLQVGGCRRIAAYRLRTARQPGVHRDGSTIIGQTRLVVLIYKVVSQQVKVLVRQFLAIHFLHPVGQQPAVQADEVRLGQFANQRGDVFMLHIGVGIVLRTGSGIGCLTIVRQKLQFVHHFAVLRMALPVEHERLCHPIMPLAHQGFLYQILNLFHLDAVVQVEPADDFRNITQADRLVHRTECFDNGIHYLVEREAVGRSVPLHNCKVIGFHHCFHCFSCFVRPINHCSHTIWLPEGYSRHFADTPLPQVCLSHKKFNY